MIVSNLPQLVKAFARAPNKVWSAIVAWFRNLREQRPRLFYSLVTILVVIVIATPGGLIFSSTSMFCGMCHEMQPEHVTWQASSHANIGCSDCHVGGKAYNLPHKIKALGELYLHVTKQVPYHIEFSEGMPNETCEDCHTKNRSVTASGDLKIPHAQHISVEGVECISCHSGVAHAEVVARNEDLGQNSNELVAQAKLVEAKDFRPSMETCIGCHKERKATLDCESCHKEIKTPANHAQAQWKVQHGAVALTTYNDCLYCHAIIQGKSAEPNQNQPLLAIRDNETCAQCHTQRPSGHDASWALGHRQAAANDKTACLVCHDEQRTPGSKAEKVVACAQCHSSNHPQTWIQDHPKQVKQAGMGDCFRCHDAKSCATCHTQRGVDRR